ncbi:MAG: alanine racemase [Clostridia bacterium]|nr:alanine racemase [Clostridia bacterium]
MNREEQPFLRRSWAEVNLSQLAVNMRLCRARLPKTAKLMAVVKADAYGHGHVPVSRCLEEAGADAFAVATVNEAIELRLAGITRDILILGYTPVSEWEKLASHDLIQTLVSEDYAHALWEACHKPLRCQFAIDTGMNRIGLPADDPEHTEACIRRFAKCFAITGIFTHLCVADGEDEASRAFTREQIGKFEFLADRLSDLAMPYVHCLNSAGGLYHTTMENGFARLGIVLYGLKPDRENTLPDGVAPALSWKSVVAMIKTVKAGETVGYGRAGKTTRETRIATVPTGYADGYSRALSGKGYVLLHGRRAPIVGRVCMDMMMLDVTDIPDACVGDEVTLIGCDGKERITADDMADMIGTIGYEVVCAISGRVPRIYTKNIKEVHT